MPDLSPFSDWKVSGEIAGRKTQTVVFGQLYAGTNQYGFRRGRWTIDVILEMRRIIKDKYVPAIFFDIRRAFDHVWWPSILYRLRERGCPRILFLLVTCEDIR